MGEGMWMRVRNQIAWTFGCGGTISSTILRLCTAMVCTPHVFFASTRIAFAAPGRLWIRRSKRTGARNGSWKPRPGDGKCSDLLATLPPPSTGCEGGQGKFAKAGWCVACHFLSTLGARCG